MRRTLEEMLDYAEECLEQAQFNPQYMITNSATNHVDVGYWQRQSIAASSLAQAMALAAPVRIKPPEVDLSE